MDLPVENYEIDPAKSPELLAERLSSGRLIMEKSIRSKLQTPKVSIPMSERKSIEGSNHYQDQNATLDPPYRESQEHLVDDYEIEVI